MDVEGGHDQFLRWKRTGIDQSWPLSLTTELEASGDSFPHQQIRPQVALASSGSKIPQFPHLKISGDSEGKHIFLAQVKSQNCGMLGNNIQRRVMSQASESENHTERIEGPFKVEEQENHMILLSNIYDV